MAAHITALAGHRLRDMLCADGWEQKWERAGRCHLRSPNGKHRGFYLNEILDQKIVQSIAHTAGWGTERFQQMFLRTMPTTGQIVDAFTLGDKPTTSH